MWEITNKWMNSVASYVRSDEEMRNPNFRKQFGRGGSPLQWAARPGFTIKVEKGKKKPKPRADINTINAPGPILNGRAKDALGDLLDRFGQFLEVDVDGDVEYYYNVTHVIPALDVECSQIKAGFVDKAVFHAAAIPSDPAVFIAPFVASRIFVNDSARTELEARIATHGLVGMSFVEREVV